jgi:thiamine-monophosphate kinase
MPELALIERIARRTALRPGTSLGIGDDSALIALGDDAVATHDMLVEGVHFRRATISTRDLGAKALAVNVSDIAAMGAVPVAALVGLGVPHGMTDDEVDDLYAGMEEVAAHHGVTIAGGDVTTAPVLVLAVTALGRAAPGVVPLRRSGGRVGDLLCVTGPLGAAAAGLLLLEAPELAPGLRERDALVAAHRRPSPRVAAGLALAAGGATAMMDLSDGLGLDARRMAVASGVRARIDLSAVPLAPGVADVARAAGRDPLLLAATGGEDYELLAAVPPTLLDGLRATAGALHVVGALTPGTPDVDLVDPDGTTRPAGRLGWTHGD